MVVPAMSGAARSKTRHHSAVRVHGRLAAADIFGVLGRPADSADRQNEALKGAASHDPQLEPDAARVVGSDSTGTLWLVPKQDGEVCLGLQPPPGSGLLLAAVCSDSADALAHGIVLGSRGQLYGAAPDGVSSVTADRQNGPTAVVPVQSNAYRLPADTTAVQFAGPRGNETLAVQTPNGAG
jgi:hypothetical protein